MGPSISCIVLRLEWFDWRTAPHSWAILVAWLIFGGAQAWLAFRSRELHRILGRLPSMAERGEWQGVASTANPCHRAALAAAVSLLLIPASVWFSARWADHQRAWDFLDPMRFTLADRIGTLNQCASIAPLVGVITAVAWGCYVADALRLQGLRRAASIALRPSEPSAGAPFRRLDRSDESVGAWLAAPGPKRRELVIAALLLVATGLTPLCIGVHESLAGVVDTFNCRWAQRDELLQCVRHGLESSEKILEAVLAAGVLGCLVSSAMIAAAMLAPARARRRLCGEVQSGKARYVLCGACAGIALLMTAATQPYAEENALYFPVEDTHGRRHHSGFTGLVDADGPDELLEGPSVDVGERVVDGIKSDIEEVLRNKRQLWLQLSPGRQFPGVVLLHCREGTSSRQLAEVAGAAARAGYTTAVLAPVRHVRQTRPVLGDIELEVWSGIHVIIGDDSTDVTLSDSEFQSCAELMREAAKLRRERKRIRLAMSDPD